MGFEVTARYGESAVFLSAGGYHHHVGLNTWAGKGVMPPPLKHSGVYHFAILYPTRKDLALTLKNLIDNKYPLTGFSDHGVSEAVYLNDPDGIGVELYVDRPREHWKFASDGKVEMVTKPLDIENLLREL